MSDHEVYPNPTVKTVSFEVRFPSLFFLENKIGEFQLKIMKEFPKSQELIQRKFFYGDVGSQASNPDLSVDDSSQGIIKIWSFNSDSGETVNLKSNSLSIHSLQHKSYNSPTAERRFRELIKSVIDNFLLITELPLFDRIGLRYIDECPIISSTNEAFMNYYNSAFPLNRFNLADASEIYCVVAVKRQGYTLRYIEALQATDNQPSLLMDFDGFSGVVESDQYLNTTDKLWEIIHAEWENSIKEPLKVWMRKPKEIEDEQTRG